MFRCAKRSILPSKAETSEKAVRSFYGQNSAVQSHNLLAIPQSTPTINRNFSLTKNSSHREKISYICGLRARIECEPGGKHSPRSDRVTNIGYLLPAGASVLPNSKLLFKILYTVTSNILFPSNSSS